MYESNEGIFSESCGTEILKISVDWDPKGKINVNVI